MNFLDPFIKLKIIFLFLASFLFHFKALYSAEIQMKGSPVINGYYYDNIVNSSPNFSLIIDKNGILYLGQKDKISIFNGSSWYFLSSKGKNILCLTDNNIVFFSGRENLGYLIPDSRNRISLQSIKEKLPHNYKNFTTVKNIVSAGDDVYFQIDSSLLVFNDGKFKILHENYPGSALFKAKDKVIYTDNKGILFVYKDGISEKHYNTGIENICSAIASEKFLFFFDNSDYLYKADSNFNILLKKQLSYTEKVLHGFEMDDEKLFISDSDNSLFIIDQEGKLIEKWHEFPEAPGSKIMEIIYEPCRGIWVLQEKSFYLLENPEAIKRILSLPKDSGIINILKCTDDRLYFNTTKGLYYLDTGKQTEPCLLLPQYFNQLIPVPGGICAVSSDQIFLFREKSKKLIYKGRVDNCTYSKEFNFLFIASQEGIKTLSLSEEKIDSLAFFRTSAVPYLIISNKNLLWYSDFEDLYEVTFNEKAECIEKKIIRADKNWINDLCIWNDTLILVYPDKIAYLAEDTFLNFKMIPENLDNFQVYGSGNDLKSILILLASDQFKNHVLIYNNKRNNVQGLINIPSSLDFFNPSLDFSTVSQLLISTGSDIYILDLQEYLSEKYKTKTIITGIYSSRDTIFDGLSYSHFVQQISNKLNRIPYKNRSLKFRLSSSNYFEKQPQYHYELTKKNKKWSGWTNESIISFNNLDIGNYELKLNAKNFNGNSGPVTILNFRILRPSFLSGIALSVYSVVLIILCFILYKTHKLKSLRKRSLLVSAEEDKVSSGDNSIPESQVSDNVKPQSVSDPETDKARSRSRWDKYEMVTVLFSDIQGFTKIAESTNPEVLIDELDKFFFHFDSVVEKYNIEKIKTIGDAYMAAGGIPKKNSSNPVEVILAALEMQHYMSHLKKTKADIWDLRIGIHTGPVIAGEIGQKKRSYDIWGDTVNTASRMESSGEAGRVNISGVTYKHVKDFFICEYRGKIPVKYKGNIDMYFVKNLRPELSLNLEGIPNRRFFHKLQMLRLLDLEELIFSKFKEELPVNMYFHNLEFIHHQYKYAHLICKSQNLDEEETLLILTSSLLMNTGFIYAYENHENKSAELARSLLQEYKYSEKQITLISNLILSTKWNSEAQTEAEKVLYDIKMEFLGRSDFIRLYKSLFRERSEYQMAKNVEEYKKQMIKILSNHRFFTKAALRFQEVPTEEQIKRIINDDWH